MLSYMRKTPTVKKARTPLHQASFVPPATPIGEVSRLVVVTKGQTVVGVYARNVTYVHVTKQGDRHVSIDGLTPIYP